MKPLEYERILKDLADYMNSLPPKGDVITEFKKFKILKLRFKDEIRKIGTSGGYRLIVMLLVNDEKVIPFHLYAKKVVLLQKRI